MIVLLQLMEETRGGHVGEMFSDVLELLIIEGINEGNTH